MSAYFGARARPLHDRCRTWARIILAIATIGAASVTLPTAGVAAIFVCNPVDVGVFPGSRIHVRCSPGEGVGGAIEYFALSVSNSGDASRVLSVILTALASGRRLNIDY